MTIRVSLASGLASTLFAVVVQAGIPSAAEPTSFEILLDRPLPLPELRWANDLRWASDSSVWIVAARPGTYEVGLSPNDVPLRLEVAGESPDGLLLAASDGVVVAAVPFGPMSWIGSSQDLRRDVPISSIVDFDLWRDEILFLGARRDEEGHWAPEGAILWGGQLKETAENLQPRMYSASGTHADEVGICGILRLGGVRYFPDGRHVVVPGFQPGAFLYDPEGRLLHAWDTGPLGFYDRCDLDWEEGEALGRDSIARRAWVHQRQVLDEVLPWGSWPALVIRHPDGQGTRWELIVLTAEGASAPVKLPIVTASIGSHVRGDLRGDRLALVISETGPEETPAQPPRLVVLRVSAAKSPPSTGSSPQPKTSEP